MNLAQLNKFAQDFSIDPSSIGFYGEHDVVYLDLDSCEELVKKVKSFSEEEELAFYNEYGLTVMDDEWLGFFT